LHVFNCLVVSCHSSASSHFESSFPLSLAPSTHHKSCFTSVAIILAFVSFILSATAVFALVAGALIFLALLGTICCKVHRIIVLLCAALAVGCAIANFYEAATGDQVVCHQGQNCTRTPFEVLGSVAGLLWLVVSACVFKIPETSRDSGTTGGVQMDNMEVA